MVGARFVGLIFAVLVWGVAGSALGAPLAREEVPEPLRPWVDWVLRGHEEERCPFLASAPDTRRCVWPARLALELDDGGGRFRQDFEVVARAIVDLPGDRRHWPQSVMVDGKPAAVVERDKPALELEPGRHQVSGTFLWDTLPELLPVPAATGLVELRVRGQEVRFPNRDPRGQLWLGRRVVEAGEEARLDVVVHRRAIDDVPLQLETRVKLLVAGESREVVLARALPDRFVPMSLVSPLPARVEPDGRIRVQVRPGTWFLTLLARHEGPAAELSLPAIDGPWDPEEVWVFEARTALRVVQIEGVAAVDPQQTELPQEWRALPAYPMKPGSILKLVERRRGDSDPAPDRLNLARTLWLDFDGGGFTIRDELSGTMSRSWRLEMQPPTALGRVAIAGRDQFITRLEEGGAAGVEVRESALQAQADSRVEGAVRELPAVGWNHDFQQVSAMLNLPPGWKVFHATGVDDVSETWIARWTLLDLFIVLVLSLAIGAVWGRAWGAAAIAMLALVYPESGASPALWIAVVALQALVLVLPAGRVLGLVRATRLAVLAALVLASLAYMAEELRVGLYPALERPWIVAGQYQVSGAWTGGTEMAQMGVPPPAPVPQSLPAEAESLVIDEARSMADRAESYLARRKGPMVGKSARADLAYEQDRMSALDPNAKITTGPGVPRWSWLAVQLSWRGPVERHQQLRLYLLSPGLNRLLAFVRVALLAALLFCVLRVRASLALGAPGAGTAAVAIALAAVLAPPPANAADFPPTELLDDLRGRLLERPDCLPSCATASRLLVEAAGDRLTLRLEVDAAADLAVPLPGGEKHWVPAKAALDGEAAAGLALGDEGLLWLRVPRGRHQVILEGPLPEHDTVELPLPLPPRRVEARAVGWRVQGIRADGVVDGTIALVRERKEGEEKKTTLEPRALPPFVRVERVIRLGLSREAETRVVRLTPVGTPIVIEVPLLAGEAPTTPDLRVEKGRALVQLAPLAQELAWHSILEPTPKLELRADDAANRAEVWIVDAAPIWHVEATGIPTIHRQEGGPRIREWRPWPGENVTIAVTRPEGVEGPTLTIDRAALVVRPGKRTTDATIELEIRSSRGAEHALTLPPDAELQSVAIDGATQPLRQEERKLTLPVHPGNQNVSITWREPRGISTRFATSTLELGAPSVNDDVTIEMPADRWTLFVGGGRFGPAVLFWSALLVVALAAWALAQLGWTPLGVVSWFLLGVGLTQVSLPSAAIVVGWLLVLGWRRRDGARLSDRNFDLVQIALVLWTFAAFSSLFDAIRQGLLGAPEMQIQGNGSHSAYLHWTFDRSGAGAFPAAWAISVPLFVYRLAMLAWALWIAASLIRWIRWGWAAFSEGGLWRKDAFALRRKKETAPKPA